MRRLGNARSPLARVAAVLLGAAVGWSLTGIAAAQPSPAGRPQDEAAIRAATRDYVAALDRGDGPALAALWTPDGDIVDDEGQVVNGREAVGRITPPTKDAPRRAIQIHDTKLRFLSADVAVEDGVVEVTPPGGTQPHRGWFAAIWVRHEGSWKLSGLRESRISSPQDATMLEDLGWMVGDWIVTEDRAGGGPASERPATPQPRMELSVRWNPTHTFQIGRAHV